MLPNTHKNVGRHWCVKRSHTYDQPKLFLFFFRLQTGWSFTLRTFESCFRGYSYGQVMLSGASGSMCNGIVGRLISVPSLRLSLRLRLSSAFSFLSISRLRFAYEFWLPAMCLLLLRASPGILCLMSASQKSTLRVAWLRTNVGHQRPDIRQRWHFRIHVKACFNANQLLWRTPCPPFIFLRRRGRGVPCSP